MKYRLQAITDNFSCLSTRGKHLAWFQDEEALPCWKLVSGGVGEFACWVYVESAHRVIVEHGETSVPIELSWSSRYLGGQQMAFKCPDCDAPRYKLYRVENRLACRKCVKLYHRSQGESIATRRARSTISFVADLGAQGQPYGDLDPPQPDGMDRLTYMRLLMRYRMAQTDALAALAGGMTDYLELRAAEATVEVGANTAIFDEFF